MSKDILERLDEHIEFHEAIDNHKSEVSFLGSMREVINSYKDQVEELERRNNNLNKIVFQMSEGEFF